MVHPATAVYVMIASPSDVQEARDAAVRALESWNEANCANRGIALVPLRWETGSVPMLGEHPQAILNKQLVERTDIMIALFGSRIGSSTPHAISGTVEEVENSLAAGKPVHLYFSTAPHPNDVDPDQLQALRDFRDALKERGLYSTFSNPEQVTALVWQAIEHDLAALGVAGGAVALPVGPPLGVDFLAQPGRESVPKTDSKGKIRHTTKRWVDLTNRGEVDAENVKVEAATDFFIHGPDETTIHPGQSRRYPMEFMLASAQDPIIKVSWTEGDEQREKQFHVG